MGDEVEEGMVVQGFTVPQNLQTPNKRKRNAVGSTKLSCHGARQPIPRELFLAFEQKGSIVLLVHSESASMPRRVLCTSTRRCSKCVLG